MSLKFWVYVVSCTRAFVLFSRSTTLPIRRFKFFFLPLCNNM